MSARRKGSRRLVSRAFADQLVAAARAYYAAREDRRRAAAAVRSHEDVAALMAERDARHRADSARDRLAGVALAFADDLAGGPLDPSDLPGA